MGYSKDWDAILKWLHVATLVLSLPIISMGVWLINGKGARCENFLQKPVLVLGVALFLIALVGVAGSLRSSSLLHWLCVIVMGIIVLMLIAFTLFAFIVASDGHGTTVPGLSFKEYNLKNYNSWFKSQWSSFGGWDLVENCFSHSSDEYCEHLNLKYPTLEDFSKAKLSPTESGCCRPPLECGFKQVNATYYEITNTTSTNPDCKLFQNDLEEACFYCSSCKAGYAEYVKDDWMTAAIVMIFIDIALIIINILAYFALHNLGLEQKRLQLNKVQGNFNGAQNFNNTQSQNYNGAQAL